MPVAPPVSVVVATRDRRARLLETLSRLVALEERPPVIVVDNGSRDGGPEAVAEQFPEVRLIRLPHNLGAPARTLGAAAATTPYVAFADDDSWWEPGALSTAADRFDRHPQLAVIAARLLVGAEGRNDPLNAVLARSPLGQRPGLPGPSVLGFLACAAVVRRHAFLAAGGFDDLVFFAGEEQLVALDLADAGWQLCYVEEVVARHHPQGPVDPARRRAQQLGNDVLTAWLRRSPSVIFLRTVRLGGRAVHDPAARRAVRDLFARLPRALARRRSITAATAEEARRVA